MKLIPLLFSTPLAFANMIGMKTETRRDRDLDEINNHPDQWKLLIIDHGKMEFVFSRKDVIPLDTRAIKSPFGKPGDVLWQRETHGVSAESGKPVYKAGPLPLLLVGDNETYLERLKAELVGKKWTGGIHMKYEHCRFFAKVLSVGLERLSDITDEGAIAEGVRAGYYYEGDLSFFKPKPRVAYFALWEKINGTGSVTRDPWVWVIKYERCERPPGKLADYLVKRKAKVQL